jgi:hypothetical protein
VKRIGVSSEQILRVQLLEHRLVSDKFDALELGVFIEATYELPVFHSLRLSYSHQLSSLTNLQSPCGEDALD